MIFLFILWILLSWPFEHGKPVISELVTGAVTAFVVGMIIKEMTTQDFARWLSPVRFFWFGVYLVVLTYYIIKANFDVAYRVLHPDMPIHPGIVKVKTKLKTATGVAALANSITLRPGTLTLMAGMDGYLYVHCLNVKSADIDEATKNIVAPIEWVIKRIFE